jgi:hypothetical protein
VVLCGAVLRERERERDLKMGMWKNGDEEESGIRDGDKFRISIPAPLNPFSFLFEEYFFLQKGGQSPQRRKKTTKLIESSETCKCMS